MELNFFEPPPDDSPPFLVPQSAEKNYEHTAHKVDLVDIRGSEDSYSLDSDAFQAFQGVHWTTPDESLYSDAEVEKAFYPEAEKFILDTVEGVHRVIIFNHVIRKEQGGAGGKPAFSAHIDQTSRAAESRVRHYVANPEEAEELLRGRVRILNVWRPLNGTIRSCPLAFANGASLQPDDLVPIELRLPDRKLEILGVKHNHGQKWMYWSGMENDQCLLLKCNDSKAGVANQMPHSAFHDPRTPVGAKGRESIEVRGLVFG